MKIFRKWIFGAVCLIASLGSSAASAANYQGLWYGGPSDWGWNVNISHQDDVLFVLWATYDDTGKATWLSMTAAQGADGSFSGTLYKSRVAPFNTGYDPSTLTLSAVGTATLSFPNDFEGHFTYRLGETERTKVIGRYGINPRSCTFRGQDGPLSRTNPTDIWFADPAGAEPGWAVAIAYLYDALAFTWFTYDMDGTPTWYYGEANGVYGDYDSPLLRLSGPSYLAATPDPATISAIYMGGVEVEWSSDAVSFWAGGARIGNWTSKLTRYVYRGKGTSCEN